MWQSEVSVEVHFLNIQISALKLLKNKNNWLWKHWLHFVSIFKPIWCKKTFLLSQARAWRDITLARGGKIAFYYGVCLSYLKISCLQLIFGKHSFLDSWIMSKSDTNCQTLFICVNMVPMSQGDTGVSCLVIRWWK